MKEVFYRILQIFFKILTIIIRRVFILLYGRKGKNVPEVKNTILLKSATQLAREIRQGRLKSEVVIQAYIERIEEVEPYINATAERCFTKALEQAKKVDALIASKKLSPEELAIKKPLLGVPISIKLLLAVQDLKGDSGSLIFKDVTSSEDALSVSLMKQAGAIVITTTNTPEMGLYVESNNVLHGKTSNPYDTTRTSGGSSGGESALLGAAGSVLGLGNDLLGSIRLPAHFTGIFGHKPTRGLVPNQGCIPEPNAEIDAFLSTGPMCRYAEDLATSMEILSSQSGHSINFKEPVDFSKLKMLYLDEISGPLVTAVEKEITQNLKRAISYFKTSHNTTTEKIEGTIFHDVTRLTTHLFQEAVKDIKALVYLDRGTHINPKLEFIKFLFGKSVLSQGPLLTMNLSKFPLWYNEKNIPYYQEMLRTIAVRLDSILEHNVVLLMPTFPVVSPYHWEMFPYLPSVCYTAIFNFLGFPSTQCPLGVNGEGLPFGIQIVGRKHSDALTIACAAELEKVFGGWIPPGNRKR